MSKLKVFHAFSGVDSQLMAECRVFGGGNIECIGTMEVDCDAIISSALIHYNDTFNMLYNVEWSDIDYNVAMNELSSKNIGFDFENNKSKLPRMKKDKLKQLYIASILTHNYGDISLANKVKIPIEIDLFTYSSPCQSFSIAGKQAGLSGTSGLLLECEKFIEINKPKFLLLENVKNLVGKKFINDFKNWLKILDTLGYNSYYEILNAKDFNVPQNRERVFCLSIRKDIDKGFKFPEKIQLNKSLKDILEENIESKYYFNNERANKLKTIISQKYPNKDIIPCDSTLNLPKELEVANCITARYNAGIQNQRSIGVAVVEQRSDEGIRYFKNNICGTLRTIDACGDKRIIEKTNNDYMIRKLTPKECWKLMDVDANAFDKVKDYISDAQLYKQAGNSIVVACLEHIFLNLKKQYNL